MEDTPTAGEPASQPDPPETPSPSVLKPILIISAVIIGLCAGCVTLFSAVGDDDPSGHVTVACRDWVKERLKAPATADFSQETAAVEDSAANRWKVTGVVDSENSFGAKVRSRWTCIATHEGDTTSLVDITVDG